MFVRIVGSGSNKWCLQEIAAIAWERQTGGPVRATATCISVAGEEILLIWEIRW